jgi:hypothetical protein
MQIPHFPKMPDGRVAPEQVVAEAMWDADLRRVREHTSWKQIGDAVPYAYAATNALRKHGYLTRSTSDPTLHLKRRPPFPRFENEADLAQRVLSRLSMHFAAETEVRGRHWTGRTLRLDAVLRPRDASGWRDKNAAFGVEFKLAHQRSHDTHRFAEWARQAVDYTQTEWSGYGRLYIFACPSPIVSLGGSDGWLMAHLLGQFGVGELSPFEREGWALTVHDHIVWSEQRGVAAGARWSLRPRLGGRR